MVKVALVVPSLLTSTFFISARSWEISCFLLVDAALEATGPPSSSGSSDSADLKASLRAYTASFVSLATVRTPLLLGIFMRL